MSNTSIGLQVHPVVDAVNAADEILDSVSDAAMWALSDDDLQTALEGCQRVIGRQFELRSRLIGEADGRDLGRRLGATCTAAWLRARLRLRPGDAKQQVDLAHRIAVGGEEPVDNAASVAARVTGREMPATGAALAEGAIGIDHAVIVATTMSKLPDRVSTEQAQQAEHDLAGFAREYDPATLQRLATYLLHVLETETLEDDEDERYRRRDLRFDELSGKLRGRLDAEGMATVHTALDALAAPQPAEDGTPDPRTAGQRLADALVELARRALGSDMLPANHGHQPHMMILAGLDTLTADQECPATEATAPDADNARTDNDADASAPDAGHEADGNTGGQDTDGEKGTTDVVDGTTDHARSDDEDATSTLQPGTEDATSTLEPGADTGDSSSAKTGGTDQPTGEAGEACPLKNAAAGGVAPGELLWGGPISAKAVRRIACDAGIRRVIFGPKGEVLDVGREYRIVTPAQFAGLIARDGGCAFPGCTRPASWCIAHHIIFWVNGGVTSLDNLVLLCGHHHRVIHHQGWDVRMAADRLPEFIPPTWIDPARTPRRNNRPRIQGTTLSNPSG